MAAGCIALAAISLLIPSSPTTDPWGWIVWGREVAALDLNTGIGGAPSWKPLPVLFTTVFSLAGDAAPQLWLVASRAAGLVALVLAFVLGRRLAGPVAGVVAAVCLLLLHDWFRGLLNGYSEPMVVALLLGAVELHLRGRARAAFLLGCLAGLGRPEVWPFAGVYALWLWRHEPAPDRAGAGWPRPGLLAAGLVSMPLLWFGGDFLGSGDAFHGGQSASSLTREIGLTPLDQLWIALDKGVLAIVALAVAAVVLTRKRHRLVLWLGGGALAWALLLLALNALGYPASPRFYTMPLAAVCVLAGAGAVGLGRLVLRPTAGRPATPVVMRGAVAVGLAAAAVALVAGRALPLPDTVDAAGERHRLQAGLRETARELERSPARVVTPRSLHWNHGALAWELELPLPSVESLETAETVGRGVVVVFDGPAPRRMTGSLRPLGGREPWHAYRVEQRPPGRLARLAPPSGP